MAKRARNAADDDDSWPPDCRDNPEIKTGDGSRWHFLGTADALLRAGVLTDEAVPGNPACPNRWYCCASYDGQYFYAQRLGKNIAVTLVEGSTKIVQLIVTKLKVR